MKVLAMTQGKKRKPGHCFPRVTCPLQGSGRGTGEGFQWYLRQHLMTWDVPVKVRLRQEVDAPPHTSAQSKAIGVAFPVD